jgi:hypothetical protein
MRVEVWFEDEDAWFEGTVSEYEKAKGWHVQYDDGDSEWEGDGEEDAPIRLLPSSSSTATAGGSGSDGGGGAVERFHTPTTNRYQGGSTIPPLGSAISAIVSPTHSEGGRRDRSHDQSYSMMFDDDFEADDSVITASAIEGGGAAGSAGSAAALATATVATAALPHRPDDTVCVGMRVEVYFEDEEDWFEGMVSEYEKAKGWHVQYDDGDSEWEDTDQADTVAPDPDTTRGRGRGIIHFVGHEVTRPPAPAPLPQVQGGKKAGGRSSSSPFIKPVNLLLSREKEKESFRRREREKRAGNGMGLTASWSQSLSSSSSSAAFAAAGFEDKGRSAAGGAENEHGGLGTGMSSQAGGAGDQGGCKTGKVLVASSRRYRPSGHKHHDCGSVKTAKPGSYVPVADHGAAHTKILTARTSPVHSCWHSHAHWHL